MVREAGERWLFLSSCSHTRKGWHLAVLVSPYMVPTHRSELFSFNCSVHLVTQHEFQGSLLTPGVFSVPSRMCHKLVAFSPEQGPEAEWGPRCPRLPGTGPCGISSLELGHCKVHCAIGHFHRDYQEWGPGLCSLSPPLPVIWL